MTHQDDSFYADSNSNNLVEDVAEAADELSINSADIKTKRKKAQLLDGEKKAQLETYSLL